ncbi:MAG TPA: hypothetical protein VFJ74_00540 [Gemmatimonadaceae bacterium]|nr:hypothetical protein [Gemmatimonadaceae bacterium]
MSTSTNLRTHLRGLLGAIQFAWIPVICAAAIAVATEQTIGRAIAGAVALAALVLGVAMHASEIFLGRGTTPAGRKSEAPFSTGEWMARVR